MAFQVGNNSYLSVEDADIYHLDHGNSAWESATSKEAALINATSFIDSLCRGKWKGVKTSSSQLLAWPRAGVVDDNGYSVSTDVIPMELRAAVCEAAVRIAQGGNLEPDDNRNVASESVAGAVSMSYFQGQSSVPVLTKINRLLNGLLDSSLDGSGAKIISLGSVYKNHALL